MKLGETILSSILFSTVSLFSTFNFANGTVTVITTSTTIRLHQAKLSLANGKGKVRLG